MKKSPWTAVRDDHRRTLVCLAVLAGAYSAFERFGQPLWTTHWNLYLFLEGLTHLTLAAALLALFHPIDKRFWAWIPLTLVPDVDHLLWAEYRNFFHTPIFILSPLLFRGVAPKAAVNLTALFAVHWIFDTRSTMAWWKPESVWVLPPIGVPMLPPWAPLAGLLALAALVLVLRRWDLRPRGLTLRIGQATAGVGLVVLALRPTYPAHGGGSDPGTADSGGGVRLELPAHVTIETDESASLTATIIGEGPIEASARLFVRAAPKGWEVGVPEGPFTLAPGERRLVPITILAKGGPPTFTESSVAHEVAVELEGEGGRIQTARLTAKLEPGTRSLSLYFGLPFLFGSFTCANGAAVRRRRGALPREVGSWMVLAGGVLAIVCGASAAGLVLLP